MVTIIILLILAGVAIATLMGDNGLINKANDAKYVDLYTNISNDYSNYDGAKIGDVTKETKGWNEDYYSFVYSSYPVFERGRYVPS